MNGHQLLAHLLTDYLCKAGIVVLLAVLVGIACVVIWKRAGR